MVANDYGFSGVNPRACLNVIGGMHIAGGDEYIRREGAIFADSYVAALLDVHQNPAQG